MQLGALMGLTASKSIHINLVYNRKYNSSDVKQACDGADVAIVCLGTGEYQS